MDKINQNKSEIPHLLEKFQRRCYWLLLTSVKPWLATNHPSKYRPISVYMLYAKHSQFVSQIHTHTHTEYMYVYVCMSVVCVYLSINTRKYYIIWAKKKYANKSPGYKDEFNTETVITKQAV